MCRLVRSKHDQLFPVVSELHHRHGTGEDKLFNTLRQSAKPKPVSAIEKVVQEMLLATTSERQGRIIDRDSGDGSMEKKKQEGYF